jgi:hypothetical protein
MEKKKSNIELCWAACKCLLYRGYDIYNELRKRYHSGGETNKKNLPYSTPAWLRTGAMISKYTYTYNFMTIEESCSAAQLALTFGPTAIFK